MSVPTAKNKNIRLTHEAWFKLRELKFDLGLTTYSNVFDLLFNNLEGNTDITDLIKTKMPKDTGVMETRKDKTIVVTADTHHRLAAYKIKFLRQTEATSRGPGAVSISDVVITLIDQYKNNNQ